MNVNIERKKTAAIGEMLTRLAAHDGIRRLRVCYRTQPQKRPQAELHITTSTSTHFQLRRKRVGRCLPLSQSYVSSPVHRAP